MTEQTFDIKTLLFLQTYRNPLGTVMLVMMTPHCGDVSCLQDQLMNERKMFLEQVSSKTGWTKFKDNPNRSQIWFNRNQYFTQSLVFGFRALLYPEIPLLLTLLLSILDPFLFVFFVSMFNLSYLFWTLWMVFEKGKHLCSFVVGSTCLSIL